MMLQISTASYLTLCALLHDAMQVESDAGPVLARVASELSLAAAGLPADLRSDVQKMAALEQAGFIRRAAS